MQPFLQRSFLYKMIQKTFQTTYSIVQYVLDYCLAAQHETKDTVCWILVLYMQHSEQQKYVGFVKSTQIQQ